MDRGGGTNLAEFLYMAKPYMIKDFTPALDTIVENHDVLTALVYGRVWRYCQMEEGKCFASQKKLAEDLRVSIKTIERRLKLLVEEKYLIDLTPERRNKPHEYIPTGKAGIKLSAEAFDTTQSRTSASESRTTTTESLSQTDLESVEESSKKQSKKPNNIFNPEYTAMLEMWRELFPNKPQPRPETKSYRSKVNTRFKDKYFRENWNVALKKASKNSALQKESWFNFLFFINSEMNFEKIMSGFYDWMHDKAKPKSKLDQNMKNLQESIENE